LESSENTQAVKFRSASLGNGTAGVLLTLLEYYRITSDETIRELLEKGLSWLKHEVSSRPFSHGFYLGTTGVTFVLSRIEEFFHGENIIFKPLLEKIQGAEETELHSLNLPTGISGTLIGLMLLGISEETLSKIPEQLFQTLLSGAKPSSSGVYWDHQQTSLDMPCGFATGNAGVDYCFAWIARNYGYAHLPILRASLEHVENQFDLHAKNWPDHDAPNQLRSIDFNTTEELLNSKDVFKYAESIKSESNLSWAGGTLGILISRIALLNGIGDLY
jgi:lantibiotic modifying enzyme